MLSGLALLLTCSVMAPTGDAIARDALEPYASGRINQAQLISAAYAPLRRFMVRQAHAKDVALFAHIARARPGIYRDADPLKTPDEAPCIGH